MISNRYSEKRNRQIGARKTTSQMINSFLQFLLKGGERSRAFKVLLKCISFVKIVSKRLFAFFYYNYDNDPLNSLKCILSDGTY